MEWGKGKARDKDPTVLLHSSGAWDKLCKPARFPLLVPIGGMILPNSHRVIRQNVLGVFVKNAKSEADPRPSGSGALSKIPSISIYCLRKCLCGERWISSWGSHLCQSPRVSV